MDHGEAWVFDTWRAHAVTNHSSVDRIHLLIDLEPRDILFDLMFDGIDPIEIFKSMSFSYPKNYTTDINTLHWLTGGEPEIGVPLWNTTIVENNPQLSKYKYNSRFWESA